MALHPRCVVACACRCTACCGVLLVSPARNCLVLQRCRAIVTQNTHEHTLLKSNRDKSALPKLHRTVAVTCVWFGAEKVLHKPMQRFEICVPGSAEPKERVGVSHVPTLAQFSEDYVFKHTIYAQESSSCKTSLLYLRL